MSSALRVVQMADLVELLDRIVTGRSAHGFRGAAVDIDHMEPRLLVRFHHVVQDLCAAFVLLRPFRFMIFGCGFRCLLQGGQGLRHRIGLVQGEPVLEGAKDDCPGSGVAVD